MINKELRNQMREYYTEKAKGGNPMWPSSTALHGVTLNTSGYEDPCMRARLIVELINMVEDLMDLLATREVSNFKTFHVGHCSELPDHLKKRE
jgi:hypothetical protein